MPDDITQLRTDADAAFISLQAEGLEPLQSAVISQDRILLRTTIKHIQAYY